jgi:hemoglobin/transferrin/lactoferrin receptor protein
VLVGRAALLAGVSFLATAGTASAQADASEGAATKLALDRIVVTAGAEKVAADTPQAVTALDQEDIDQSQASTMADLIEAIPGVSAMGGVSALGQGFNIRGLGTGLADSDSRILMQIDGTTKFFEQYRMGAFFSEPELYKRAEVLRGPASSTLYGAGALAGVVNFTTKDAADFLEGDDRFALRLKAGYETNANGRLGSAILAFRPAEDLDVLAAYNVREADHYENGDGQEIVPSNVTSSSYLLKARYHLGGQKGHNIWASYQNWLSDSTQIYDQAEAFGTTPVRRKVDDVTATFGYENDFGGSSLFDVKAQVSYADSTVEQRETTFLSGVVYSEFSYRSWQGRIENATRFDLGPDWTGILFFGVQASRQERRNPRLTTTGSTNYGATTHPEGDMSKYGVFAQAEVMWSDRLTISPGVRIDRTRLEPGMGVTTRQVVEDDAVSPKIAAIYSVNEHLAVFGSVARTARLPVLDEIYSRTSAAATNYALNLEPEESDNYEIGFSLSLDDLVAKGDAMRLKATAYRNDVSNLITRGTAASAYFVNVGESRFQGLEVEAEYATRGLFVRAGLSMPEGENRVTSAPLNTVPADELDVTVGYNFRDLNLTAGWRGEFAADQDEVSVASERTAGYGVHNLFLTWRPDEGALDGLEVRLAVDNLFDKAFRRHLASLDAEGRTFKATLARTF